MSLYKNNLLDDLIKEQNNLSFEEVDSLLDFLPKDVNKIIFEYMRGSCIKCDNCCKVCRFYCYFSCLRYNNRDICCISELKTLTSRYNLENDDNDNNNNISNLL